MNAKWRSMSMSGRVKDRKNEKMKRWAIEF